MLRNVKCNSAKVCADCRFFKPNVEHYHVDERLKYGVCTHPTATDVDVITGDHKHMLAQDVRKNKDLCGPNGKNFIPEHRTLLLYRMLRAHIRFNEIARFLALLAYFLGWCALLCIAAIASKKA